MAEIKGSQKTRVTFSETVRVNLGEYEHRDSFVACSSDVEEGETEAEALKRVTLIVKKKSNLEEKKLRRHAHKFVDFDTKEKLRE